MWKISLGMSEQGTRRQFLKSSGAAAVTVATAMAGCSGGGGQETTTEEMTTSDDESGDTETSDDGAQQDFPVDITLVNMPKTLDPHNHFQNAADIVAFSIYEGVLERDREGKAIAELGTEWERIEEGRIRFFVREGVKFHNGDDLTPEDVAYSINRIVKEDVGGIASPQAGRITGVIGAEVVDGEHAIDVVSDGPNPMLITNLATYVDIMQESWVEERESSEVAVDTNGTGPFQMTDYDEGVEVVLERFDEYWREPATVSELTFTAANEEGTRVNRLLAGETDIITGVSPQSVSRIENNDATTVDSTISIRTVFAAMQAQEEPFTSQEFRQAMNYAVDKKAIIENTLNGYGRAIGQPAPPGFIGYNPDVGPYPYDPDQAEQLVEESGFAGAEVELHGAQGDFLKSLEVSQAVADYIDDLSNVSCEFVQREGSSLEDEYADGEISNNSDIIAKSAGNDTFDAGLTIQVILTEDGFLPTFNDPDITELTKEFMTEPNLDRRAELIQDASAQLHDLAPWIYLHQEFNIYVSSNRVEWEAAQDEMLRTYDMQPANGN
jgi:peptide/nickel transport system substrate-binding protein